MTNNRLRLLEYGLLVLLCCVEAWAFFRIHAMFYPAIVVGSRDVLMGRVINIAFQNRVLGPWIIACTAKLTGLSYLRCHVAFSTACLFIANVVSYSLLRLRGNTPPRAFLFVGLSALIFLAIENRDRHGDWDLIDLTTMFLFAYGVFTWQPKTFFALLYCLEILNREAAQFIAFWLVLTALNVRDAPAKRIDIPRVSLGVGLFAAGSLWIQLARKFLVSIPPSDIHEVVLGGQHFLLFSNLRAMAYVLHSHGTMVSAVMTLASVALIIGRRKELRAPAATALLLGAMVGSIYMFALIKESRVWTGVIPFLMFLLLPLPRRESAGVLVAERGASADAAPEETAS